MATKRSSSTAATAVRSSPKTAGKPTEESAVRSRRAVTQPTSEELDLRDRLKSSPRRPAGPPLVGDVTTRSAMEALRNEVLPEPTDPAKPSRRS